MQGTRTSSREIETVTPDIPRRTYIVPRYPEPLCQRRSAPGPLHVRYEGGGDTRPIGAQIRRPSAKTPLAAISLDIMPFLLPSRFVPVGSAAPFALREFGKLPKGHVRVTAICKLALRQTSTIKGDRRMSRRRRTKACCCAPVSGRDFAHLGVAFCRALSIPARIVSCYAHGPGAERLPCGFRSLSRRSLVAFRRDQDRLISTASFASALERDAAEIAFCLAVRRVRAGHGQDHHGTRRRITWGATPTPMRTNGRDFDRRTGNGTPAPSDTANTV